MKSVLTNFQVSPGTFATDKRARKIPSAQSIGLGLLGLAGLGSLGLGVRRGLIESQDLQWGGAWLLAHHINPWEEALAGYPHHLQPFSPPNYLHHLYVLLLPLSWMSAHAAAVLWCVLNVVLSFIIVSLLARQFALSREHRMLLLFLLWISSPFRVLLAAGQMTMVELFCFTLTFSSLPVAARGIAFGVSFAKYSFTPPTALYLAFRGRFRLLLIAAVVPVLGVLVAGHLLGTPLLHLAVEPFALASRAVMPGLADLMTLLERISTLQHVAAQRLAFGVALAGSMAYAFLLSRFHLARTAEFTLLAVVSLFLFKHLSYDYVFLLVPLAFALSGTGRKIRNAVVALVLAFWLLPPLLNRFTYPEDGLPITVLLAENLLLGALLVGLTVFVLQNSTLRRVGNAPAAPALD